MDDPPRRTKRRKRELSPEQRRLLEARRAINAAVGKGDLAGALAQLRELRAEGASVEPSHVTPVLSVSVATKSGAAAEEAFALVRLARDEDGRIPAVSAPVARSTESAYSLMIKLYATTGDVDAAERLVAELREASVEVRLRTLSPIMRTLADQGQPARVLSLLRQAVSDGLAPGEPEYRALLEAHANAEEVDGRAVGLALLEVRDKVDTVDEETVQVLKQLFNR